MTTTDRTTSPSCLPYENPRVPVAHGASAIARALREESVPVIVAGVLAPAVAAVELPSGARLSLTLEGDAVLVEEHTEEQWTNPETSDHESCRRFAGVDSAARWVRERRGQAAAIEVLTRAGIVGGHVRVDDREPLDLDSAARVIEALDAAGLRITHAR